MTPEEIQELREWAAGKMGWFPPEPLPEGRYTAIEENEELGIGPIVGWRHNDTNKFYSNKEWEKFEYWTTKDGEPAKAPWGGLIYRTTMQKWQPDNPSTGQIWLLVEKMREDGWNLLLHNDTCSTRYRAEFDGLGNKSARTGFDTNPCLAILLAARATEGK